MQRRTCKACGLAIFEDATRVSHEAPVCASFAREATAQGATAEGYTMRDPETGGRAGAVTWRQEFREAGCLLEHTITRLEQEGESTSRRPVIALIAIVAAGTVSQKDAAAFLRRFGVIAIEEDSN